MIMIVSWAVGEITKFIFRTILAGSMVVIVFWAIGDFDCFVIVSWAIGVLWLGL